MEQNVSFLGSVAKTSGGTGTVTYSLTGGTLPTGLNLDVTTGAIIGTPTGIGTFNFTVTATDSATPTPATKMQTYTGNVLGRVTSIATISGTPQVSQTLTAGYLTPTGATVSYEWEQAVTENGTYTKITNATDATLQLSADQAGKYIRVVVTGTGLYTGSVTSIATTMVTSSLPIVISSPAFVIPFAPAGYRVNYSGYGFVFGDYVYWPFDDEFNGGQFIIVAFNTQGIEVKRFNLSGRYVTNIVIDDVNRKITFQNQYPDNTRDWSEFEITN